ncbi:serendipity locus protein delta-like [Drosophila takahashii]|uniref:serendipity locus protein delta-like n=1 Tax=Drosophila takahashii TaxID=29030 RepID=UPI001CF91E97|nr:serendipity locus protein delta-like [Drosophila takahashii]
MNTCFFCGADELSEDGGYEKLSAKVPSSQKSVSLVLTHLAKCIRRPLDLKPSARLCPRCFQKLSEYDTIMVNLMTAQKRLASQLKGALMSEILVKAVEIPAESELFKDQYSDIVIKREYLTEDEEEEEFICDSSQVEVGDSEDKSMKKRVKQHSEQPNHICPICGVNRRDEEHLELHMNLHEGKTELQCRYCSKSFSRPPNTLRHMRMHWDKKKYQCEKCGMRFSQDNLLYNHRQRHEAEENPIICSICNVSFKTRRIFNHHTKIHKENRPRHYCSVCHKSFTERFSLKTHMKNYHESK